jgi:hypothetical protein
MSTDTGTVTDHEAADDARWAVAGQFLDALTRRDFAGLESCMDPAVRFRALVPPGPFELDGAAETVARLHRWFGEHDVFEVLDASIGQIGTRSYLHWRVRRGRAHDPSSFEVVEQHVFVTATDRVESIDLLCSGFQAEYAAPSCTVAERS